MIEAIDVILLHSPTGESVLLCTRVTREILCQYLHNNRVPMSAKDKGNLVRKILKMWDCIPHEEMILSLLDIQ
jgi:hypothetical protein